MGDGGKLANVGQNTLKLSTPELGTEISSTFQIANVTRPLMSVGKICDEGMTVTFSKTCAVVSDKDGRVVCKFERQQGRLYIAKMRLKSRGFIRQ